MSASRGEADIVSRGQGYAARPNCRDLSAIARRFCKFEYRAKFPERVDVDVRLAPNSDARADIIRLPLRANYGLLHRSKIRRRHVVTYRLIVILVVATEQESSQLTIRAVGSYLKIDGFTVRCS